MVVLTDDLFLNYAMRNYDRVSVTSVKEFEEDLQRFKYLNKALNKYSIDSDGERLILNHIIVIFNCFNSAAVNMLLFKVPKANWKTLFTFLHFLDRLPEYVPEHGIETKQIGLDPEIMKKLETI